MNFKLVTVEHSGKKTLINFDTVSEVWENDGGCTLFFNFADEDEQVSTKITESLLEISSIVGLTQEGL